MDWSFESLRQLLSDQFGGDYPYGFIVGGQVPGSTSTELVDSEEKWKKMSSCRDITLCLERYPTRMLGRGAFGEVRMVTEPSGAVFAVKKIQMDERGQAESALNEYQALEMLSHPNIARYYSCRVMKRCLYLKMEYVPYTLEDRRKGGPRWSEQELRELARQVLQGLMYLHGHNFAHRNIKESNLMVTEDGVYKLLGFGCARRLEPSEVTYAGTLGYIAPEIFDPDGLCREKILAEMQAIGCHVGPNVFDGRMGSCPNQDTLK